MCLGRLPTLQHQTSGKLYAIDEKTFFIDFEYDGLGPGEFNTCNCANAKPDKLLLNHSSCACTCSHVYLKGQKQC